jgi:hypothetical protein
MITKICERCVIEFDVPNSRVNAKYCSRECVTPPVLYCVRKLNGVKCTNVRKSPNIYCSECTLEIGQIPRYYPHRLNKDLVLDIRL